MHLLDKSRKRVGAAGKKKNARECIMRASSSLSQAFILYTRLFCCRCWERRKTARRHGASILRACSAQGKRTHNRTACTFFSCSSPLIALRESACARVDWLIHSNRCRPRRDYNDAALSFLSLYAYPRECGGECMGVIRLHIRMRARARVCICPG